uniref:1-phosphatidylinositol 4-kinase n=1 Tax=Cajanus cajan TaxID=3821 RepID=A0A151TAN7_CAJCA|nr:hypothetical protein KK1_018698 [Cajanus cajan]
MRLFKMAVTIDRHNGFKPFSRSQRCKLQSYGHLDPNTLELSQTGTFSHSFELAFQADNIHRSFSTPCLPLSTLLGEELTSHHPRVEIVRGSGAPVHALVVEVAIAMASGVQPTPLPSGLGGAYVFRNPNGNNIAVAKPIDEEPLALNNPKGLGDAEILRTKLPLLRECSIRVLFVCTILLKQAAAAGLCLAEIGQMMTRKFRGGEELPSEMEKVCLKVKASIIFPRENCKETEQGSKCEVGGISLGDLNQGEWEAFLDIFSELLHGVFEEKKVQKHKLEHHGSYRTLGR